MNFEERTVANCTHTYVCTFNISRGWEYHFWEFENSCWKSLKSIKILWCVNTKCLWNKNQMKSYNGGMQLAPKEGIYQAFAWPVRGRLRKEKYLRWLPSTTSYNLNHHYAICMTDRNNGMAYRMSSCVYIFYI